MGGCIYLVREPPLNTDKKVDNFGAMINITDISGKMSKAMSYMPFYLISYGFVGQRMRLWGDDSTDDICSSIFDLIKYH